MSTASAFTAIRGFIEAAWKQLPLEWANEPFAIPKDENGIPTPWARIRVAGNAYEVTSIGSGSGPTNRWQEEGQVMAYIFVPTGSGSLRARQYGEAFADALRGQVIIDADIEFRDVIFDEGDRSDEDGAWWCLAVSVDWIRGT